MEPRTSSSTAVPLDDAAFDDPSSSARDDGVPIARGVLARLPPIGVRPSGSFYVTRHPHAGEAAQDGDGASAQSAVIEDEYVKEADRLLRAQHELKHATELVMLVPWPLKARTLYAPPRRRGQVPTHLEQNPHHNEASTWACMQLRCEHTLWFRLRLGGRATGSYSQHVLLYCI